MRRPAGNGPFRPLPGGPAPRPFVPRPGGGGPGAPINPGQGPSPSSGAPGGRPGQRGNARDRDESKKDRETELLLEKQRQRKGGRMIDGVVQPAPTKLEIDRDPRRAHRRKSSRPR